MKILYVITALDVGGAEKLTINIANSINKDKNYEIKILYLKRKDKLLEIIDNNIRIECLDIKYNIDLFKGKNISKFRKILDEFDPDIIHTNLIHADIFTKYCLIKMKRRINVVHTFHNIAPIDRKVELFFYRFLINKYIRESYFIGISNRCINSWSKALNLSKKQIKLMYNFCEYKSVLENNKSKETIKILYVGRLEKIKGIDILIKAISRINQHEVDISIDIVGDGSLREEMKREVNKLSIDNIKFHGFSKPDNYYRDANILVVPSRQEGFGISILEGWANGNIVVGSNIGGIPELIRSKKNGFLFEPENDEDLANILKYIINNYESLQKKIINNAYKDLKKFNKEEYIRELKLLYSDIGDSYE